MIQNTKPNLRQQQMYAHVEDWQQSGLTQKAWCGQQEIPGPTFQYWLRKYRKEKSATDGFVAIERSGPSSGIHIRYPNGVEMILPPQVPVQTLQSLITAIC